MDIKQSPQDRAIVLEQLMYEYIKRTDTPSLIEVVIKAVKRADKEAKEKRENEQADGMH